MYHCQSVPITRFYHPPNCHTQAFAIDDSSHGLLWSATVNTAQPAVLLSRRSLITIASSCQPMAVGGFAVDARQSPTFF